jgi:4-amino-4-deoxy-L-arabinose transferase-like glycosyltransferase
MKKFSFVFSEWFFIVCAFVVVLAIGFGSARLHTIFEPLARSSLDGGYYNLGFVGQAVSLLHTGTFNFNHASGGYVDQSQRGPAYSILLATAFWLFGEYVGVIYGINFFLLAIAIVCMHALSKRLLKGVFVHLPPFCLSIYWGVASLVWLPSYEIFVICIACLSVFMIFKYQEKQKFIFLCIFAFLFGIWILEKPQALYFIPIALGALFCIFEEQSSFKKLRRLSILGCIVLAIVGLWAYRNYRELNTWQLGGGGHSILRRATQTDFTSTQIMSMFLSFSVGDYLGSKIYSDFPKNTEPIYWNPSVETRWYQTTWIIHDLDGSNITRVELDRKMYKEAFEKIFKRPRTFLLTGFIMLFRLNGPLNWNGSELMHLFFGTHGNISDVFKIGFVLAIRLAWSLFLGLVVLGVYQSLRDNPRLWIFIVLLVVYYNGIQALFTHAEARYIATVMPFYFLLASLSISIIFKRFYPNSNLYDHE